MEANVDAMDQLDKRSLLIQEIGKLPLDKHNRLMDRFNACSKRLSKKIPEHLTREEVKDLYPAVQDQGLSKHEKFLLSQMIQVRDNLVLWTFNAARNDHNNDMVMPSFEDEILSEILAKDNDMLAGPSRSKAKSSREPSEEPSEAPPRFMSKEISEASPRAKAASKFYESMRKSKNLTTRRHNIINRTPYEGPNKASDKGKSKATKDCSCENPLMIHKTLSDILLENLNGTLFEKSPEDSKATTPMNPADWPATPFAKAFNTTSVDTSLQSSTETEFETLIEAFSKTSTKASGETEDTSFKTSAKLEVETPGGASSTTATETSPEISSEAVFELSSRNPFESLTDSREEDQSIPNENPFGSLSEMPPQQLQAQAGASGEPRHILPRTQGRGPTMKIMRTEWVRARVVMILEQLSALRYYCEGFDPTTQWVSAEFWTQLCGILDNTYMYMCGNNEGTMSPGVRGAAVRAIITNDAFTIECRPFLVPGTREHWAEMQAQQLTIMGNPHIVPPHIAHGGLNVHAGALNVHPGVPGAHPGVHGIQPAIPDGFANAPVLFAGPPNNSSGGANSNAPH